MTLFGTAGIRGAASETVTPELALSVGRAVGADCRNSERSCSVVLARDGRVTGRALADALAAGVQSAGVTLERAGQLPTPALAAASRGRRGVMVTASHNPPEDNGIKLFVDGVEYDQEAESRIEATIESNPGPVSWAEWGETTQVDLLEAYRETVCEYARQFASPLDALEVAVDCGNGMASLATPQVLSSLGADVQTLNATVDGRFPGRASKPTPETLGDLAAFLEHNSLDLGLAHDGDADRLVVLDGTGSVVHEDTVLAVLARRYVSTSDVGDPVVVTTPNASGRIDEQVAEAGGRTERVQLGAVHEGIREVRDAGSEKTEVVFAAEPWKHIHPSFGDWFDGVASAAVFCRLVATEGGVDALTAGVTERPYRKSSVACPDEEKAALMASVEQRLETAFPEATLQTTYGVRLTFPDDSWALVRPSGTEAYIRVYAESDAVEGLHEEVCAAIHSVRRERDSSSP